MIKMPPKGQIFKLKVLESLLASENSCVTLVPCTRLLAVPAFFLNDMKLGIIFLLNKFLKKYDRALNGIPIGYQKVKVLMDENTGIIRMGNAETEVNVSVEFYIFQPKVGSSLLGVINKKSSTHIGCLVHKYFNATILKPENIDCEDWICKDLNVNDTILFKVKDLDFTGVLPYIEGIIDDENFVRNKNEESDSKKMSTDLKENDFGSATGLPENQNKKGECNDIQAKTVDRSVNNVKSFDEIDSTNNTNKKKKKVKDKRQKSPKDLEECKLMHNAQETEYEVEKKKKKKKSSNEQEIVDELPSTSVIENVTPADEQTNEHQFGTKKKKKKKDKKKESILQNDNTDESQNASMVADSIFYSTQLEPTKPLTKPSVPFCSPIPQISSFNHKKTPKEDFVNISNLDTDKVDEKKEKKFKKRKKNKDEPDSESKSKKPRISSSEKVTKKRKEIDKSESTVQNFLNEIFKEQMNRINHQSASDSEKSAKTQSKNKTLVESKKSLKSPGKVDKKKKERDKSHSTVQNILNDILNEQMMKIKKLESVSDADTEKTNKSLVESTKSSRKSEKKKERDKSQSTILDFFKGNTKEAKEGVKQNSVSEKKTKTKNSTEGLYEKLLKEARNLISADVDLPNASITGPPESDTKKKKHKSELKTNTQTNGGKLKRKRDTLGETEGPSTPKKFKNGNMYDYKYEQSPEKINPDKSLFSDSESSVRASPMKKEKQVNGLVNEKKNEMSSLEKVMKKLIKEQRKRLESETESVGKSSLKSLKKEKKKKKRKEDAEESLYEKLLKNAKSSINLSKDV